MSKLIGHTPGKYRIVDHLGPGSPAEVYKAFQPNLERYVVISTPRQNAK